MMLKDADLRDEQLLDFLQEQESVDVQWGTSYAEDFMEEMERGTQLAGHRLPWDEYHESVAFAPGEVTVHTGLNSHRKSMVCGQLMGSFALQGAKVGVMSFEMPIRKTMKRMCWQMLGTRAPTSQAAKTWLDWTHERVCFYDKFNTTPAVRVLAAASYMSRVFGCEQILIDSLMLCGIPLTSQGNEPAKEFMDVLCETARRFNSHIHLVAHAKKPEKEGDSYVPNRYNILGASDISNLAHQCVIHWANLRKARIMNSGGPRNDEQEKICDGPDQLFIVDKSRNAEPISPIALTMHDSMQFHRGRLLKPMEKINAF